MLPSSNEVLGGNMADKEMLYRVALEACTGSSKSEHVRTNGFIHYVWACRKENAVIVVRSENDNHGTVSYVNAFYYNELLQMKEHPFPEPVWKLIGEMQQKLIRAR